ncbi:hypothetical protein F4778DRAFT_782337 [Xylariomycetidae sp. FL2044]|nr:hypothetical protein F4778DRAFT_782337 [Xylariomycetidae sp. FL2044]
MQFPSLAHLSLAFVMSASLAVAIPHDFNRKTSSAGSGVISGCSQQTITACASGSNETATAASEIQCFRELCFDQAATRNPKRQLQCTEENLNQCAIMEWRDAEDCFRQFCL